MKPRCRRCGHRGIRQHVPGCPRQGLAPDERIKRKKRRPLIQKPHPYQVDDLMHALFGDKKAEREKANDLAKTVVQNNHAELTHEQRLRRIFNEPEPKDEP